MQWPKGASCRHTLAGAHDSSNSPNALGMLRKETYTYIARHSASQTKITTQPADMVPQKAILATTSCAQLLNQATTCAPLWPPQRSLFDKSCVYNQLRSESPSYSMPVSLSSRDGVAALTLQAQHTHTSEHCRLSADGCNATTVCQVCHTSQDTHGACCDSCANLSQCVPVN